MLYIPPHYIGSGLFQMPWPKPIKETHKFEVTAKDVVKFNPTFTRKAGRVVSGSLSVQGDYEPCKHAKAKLKYGINEKGILNTKSTVDGMSKLKGMCPRILFFFFSTVYISLWRFGADFWRGAF